MNKKIKVKQVSIEEFINALQKLRSSDLHKSEHVAQVSRGKSNS